MQSMAATQERGRIECADVPWSHRPALRRTACANLKRRHERHSSALIIAGGLVVQELTCRSATSRTALQHSCAVGVRVARANVKRACLRNCPTLCVNSTGAEFARTVLQRKGAHRRRAIFLPGRLAGHQQQRDRDPATAVHHRKRRPRLRRGRIRACRRPNPPYCQNDRDRPIAR